MSNTNSKAFEARDKKYGITAARLRKGTHTAEGSKVRKTEENKK